jgi:uncharacterized protein HemY
MPKFQNKYIKLLIIFIILLIIIFFIKEFILHYIKMPFDYDFIVK